MTHSELVQIAYKWVLNRGCGFAFREFYTHAPNGEYPDVIGFGSSGHSVVVEVKTSRADFFADRSKNSRKNPEKGMGRQRFYLCPQYLLQPLDMPDGWGLIWVMPDGKARMVHNPYGPGNIYYNQLKMPVCQESERAVLYSALRRLQLRGFIETIYEQKPNSIV